MYQVAYLSDLTDDLTANQFQSLLVYLINQQVTRRAIIAWRRSVNLPTGDN